MIACEIVTNQQTQLIVLNMKIKNQLLKGHCVFQSCHWWKPSLWLCPACWVTTGLLSHLPLEEVITSAEVMGGWGDGWRSRKVVGLREAYTNTGSTITMWEALHHHFNRFCLTPHFSFWKYTPMEEIFIANSGHYNKHVISTLSDVSDRK